jgi:hypothetical protein
MNVELVERNSKACDVDMEFNKNLTKSRELFGRRAKTLPSSPRRYRDRPAFSAPETPTEVLA